MHNYTYLHMRHSSMVKKGLHLSSVSADNSWGELTGVKLTTPGLFHLLSWTQPEKTQRSAHPNQQSILF